MTHMSVRITNPNGLKSRPAASFVATASKFSSQILVEVGNKKINAKSIMGVLSLALTGGEELDIFATGSDEYEAASALVEFIEQL